MRSLTLALGGDLCPTRRLDRPPVSAREVYGLVGSADVAVGDFEMPLTEGGVPVHKLLNIKADPAIAGDVPSLGFGVLTVANNHAVDYGWPALERTVARLRAEGLVVVGAGPDEAAAAAPAFVDAAGCRVGVIAFSCLTPTGMGAAPLRPGISAVHVETAYEVDPWYQMEEPGDPSVVRIRTRVRDVDRERVERLVSATRDRCDLLVVSVHWGFGSGEHLAEYQLPLGRALIEAGADVVHGHHPHAVHPIGFHLGKPILFGPGTFIGQQVFLDAPPNVQALWAAMSPDGYVARLRIGDEDDALVELHPTTLDADRLPRLAGGGDHDRVAERLARLSAPYGAAVESHGGILRAVPSTGGMRLSLRRRSGS